MKPALVAIGKEIAREAVLFGVRGFRDWLRKRREAYEAAVAAKADIDRRHVPRTKK